MPLPCRSPGMPSQKGFRLCLFHLIYTVLPCLIHTWHAAPKLRPCHATTMPFSKRILQVTAQLGTGAAWSWHGMCELASAVQRRHVGDLPAFGFFRLHAEIHEGCYQKYTNPLNCKTSSSDIFGYHADLHEGYGTVGEWQGRCMACVN
jgi:hypothetical protein